MSYPINDILNSVMATRNVANWGLFPWTTDTIDEVAVVFSTQSELNDFRTAAVAQGLENFNSVPMDTMVRQDEPGEFLVRFEFLRLPGIADFRIEAMCVLGGVAPLHYRHLAQHGTGSVVHASFKPADYAGAKSLMADDYEMQAEYRNSYGVFSYWRTHDENSQWEPYYKPRANLRDAQPLVDEFHPL